MGTLVPTNNVTIWKIWKDCDLAKLLPLFIIYAFFIILSFVIGHGVELIQTTYAQLTTGILLILSSLTVLWIFIKDFGGSK